MLIPLRDRHRHIVGYALIDEDDADLAESRWCCDDFGYAKRKAGRMHIEIARRMGILGIERTIDHKNGNTLDNRRENLRPASQSLNMRNPANRARVDSQSGVRGVWWSQERQKWCAQGTQDGIRVSLGRFDTLEEAKAARAVWESQAS